MYNYQDVMQELGHMRPWQITAASAVCAEKATPIVSAVALPDTSRIADECLRFAWEASSGLDPDPELGQQLLRDLEATPEWHCEYPDSLNYIVTRALNCFQYSVAAAVSISISDMVNNVGFSLILELANTFDVAVAEYPQLISSDLQIEAAEESSQLSVIAALKAHELPSKNFTDSLRQEASVIRDMFKKALPVYCYSFVSATFRRQLLHE